MFTLSELSPWLPLDQHKKLSALIDAGDPTLGVNYDNYKESVNSNVKQLTGYSPADVQTGAEFESAKSLLIPHFTNILKYYSGGLVGRVGEGVAKGYEHSVKELKRMSKPISKTGNTNAGGVATIGLIDNLGGF